MPATVVLGPFGLQSAGSLVQSVAHELAHSWHCFNRGLWASRWSTEGLAEVMATEQASLMFDIPTDGDISLARWTDISTVPQMGFFSSGYGESSEFLRYLALQLRDEHGVPWKEALAAAVLGSTEGWYGQSYELPTPPAGPGLTSRMRALGDAAWDPVDARLDFVLSIAADDRGVGAASRYRYAPVRNAWEHPEDKSFGNIWGIAFHRGTLTAGQGAQIAGHAFPGDNGYFLIQDPQGVGIALEGKADIDTMVWRILRFR